MLFEELLAQKNFEKSIVFNQIFRDYETKSQ